MYTIILALASAVTAGLVGGFALMKRMTLAGDVMSHIALPGLGLAFLFKINPVLGGAATMLLGVLLIWNLEKKTGLATETTIGVIFAGSVALGALITPEGDLVDALFGGFQNISFQGFLTGIIVSVGVIIFILMLKNKLILSLFSRDLAVSSGINISRLNLYFYLIFGATIILGLQFLGALLMGSLIIIPAAIARQLSTTLSKFLLIATAASVTSVALGLGISSVYHLSLGPVIVSISALLFCLSLLKT